MFKFKFISIKKYILLLPLFCLLFIPILVSCQKDPKDHGDQQVQPLLNSSSDPGIPAKVEFDENALLEKAGSCSISEINKKGEFHKPCSAKKIEENSDKKQPIY